MNQYNNLEQPPKAELLRVQPITPLISKRLFADLVGVTERTVEGWMTKGYVPTVKIGRHPLVNIALIYQQCLDQES